MQANYIDRTIAQTMIRRKTQTTQCKKKTQKHSSLQNTTHTLKIRQHGYIRKKNMNDILCARQQSRPSSAG